MNISFLSDFIVHAPIIRNDSFTTALPINRKRSMFTTKTITPAVLISTLLIAGCATTVRTPTETVNPPPSAALSTFSSFELKQINVRETCEKQSGGDVALAAIQTRLDTGLGDLVKKWNGQKNTSTPRKLIIEPICVDIKLIGTAKRIFTGALSGSSAVVMRVRYSDASTGKVIAEPVFYQRASAMGAAYSFGATDRDMLNRISALIVDYTSGNYQQAVGGPTGLEL